MDELIQTHATTLADVFDIKLQQRGENLPQIYWIPKLHETPYKARFIAGSRSCTTTRLSFSTLYTSLLHVQLESQLHNLLERVFHTKGKSFIATNSFHTFWTTDRMSMRYTYFSCRELCLAIDFLIDNIYVRFDHSVFRQVIGIPMGTNSAPLLADLLLHTFENDFMVKTMKQGIIKAIQFSNTFRYIDDLFSINNVDFGNYIPDCQLSTYGQQHSHQSCLRCLYISTSKIC